MEVRMEKIELKAKDYFLPLMDDWYIRPLYYLEHLQLEKRRQLLHSVITFAKQAYKEGKSAALRLSKSEFLMALLYVS